MVNIYYIYIIIWFCLINCWVYIINILITLKRYISICPNGIYLLAQTEHIFWVDLPKRSTPKVWLSFPLKRKRFDFHFHQIHKLIRSIIHSYFYTYIIEMQEFESRYLVYLQLYQSSIYIEIRNKLIGNAIKDHKNKTISRIKFKKKVCYSYLK